MKDQVITKLKKYLYEKIDNVITEEQALDLLDSIINRDVFLEDLTKSFIDGGTSVIWIYNDKFYSSKGLVDIFLETEELDFNKINELLKDFV